MDDWLHCNGSCRRFVQREELLKHRRDYFGESVESHVVTIVVRLVLICKVQVQGIEQLVLIALVVFECMNY